MVDNVLIAARRHTSCNSLSCYPGYPSGAWLADSSASKYRILISYNIYRGLYADNAEHWWGEESYSRMGDASGSRTASLLILEVGDMDDVSWQ